VTNEQYLYISYVVAAAAGIGLAILTAIILARPNRQATEGKVLPKLGKFLRRAFPSWLILMVLLAFISVSYIDCEHTNYAKVVASRDHLVNKTQEQVFQMSIYLSIALMSYAIVLILFLWARARTQRYHKKQARNQ
jgi:cytochrome bd-type quinol oxidase subunit 2